MNDLVINNEILDCFYIIRSTIFRFLMESSRLSVFYLLTLPFSEGLMYFLFECYYISHILC